MTTSEETSLRGRRHNPIDRVRASVRTLTLTQLCSRSPAPHWENAGKKQVDQRLVTNLVLLCPYHHRSHHRGVITITGPADALTVTDTDGRLLRPGSLARPPTQPPPAVAPCPGPTGERAHCWWYQPFQPQPPPAPPPAPHRNPNTLAHNPATHHIADTRNHNQPRTATDPTAAGIAVLNSPVRNADAVFEPSRL